jgi:hypothetical protein
MVLQGMLLGLSLSFMIGPILFAIVQAGIDRGFRAGLAVASGIWTCDVLYILLVRYGIDTLAAVTALPNFRFWAGIAGGILLLAFGLNSILSQKIPTEDTENTRADRLLDRLDGPEAPGVRHNWQQLGLPGYWLRGFLLNLINPGTMFFWLGIATAVVIPNNWSGSEITNFFSGMLGTLIAIDTLKAYAAKRLRNWLTPAHTRKVQQGIGLMLIFFGILLIVKVFAK